mgnify:FL=1
MSKTKAGGSTRNGRDSQSKRLGVKLFGGQEVKAGNIIIRQRGTKYGAGENTRLGKDYTIFATAPGNIEFTLVRKTLFSGRAQRKTLVHVKQG